MAPTYRVEEIENLTSGATQPDVEKNVVVAHEDEHASTSGVTDSDIESKTSVAFLNEQDGTSMTSSVDSGAERRNSTTSQDEQTGIATSGLRTPEFDTESKITDTFDDDGSSTTTSEDSDADADGTSGDPPPPYEPYVLGRKKKPPAFEADPVRYVLGMKLPIAESGFCACEFVTSSYATVFYITAYASLLICDAFRVIPHVIRALYAYKFQLFLTFDEQYAFHGWVGVFLYISAFVLWYGTYRKHRATLIVWMLVMLVYVLVGLVLFLLGMLLSFAADGWNMHNTTAISVGLVDMSLEFYLLHMVYSYNRYMHEKPPKVNLYDPRTEAVRHFELAQMGFREINIMGVPFQAPISRRNLNEQRRIGAVTSV